MLSRIVKSDWRSLRQYSSGTRASATPGLLLSGILYWDDVHVPPGQEIIFQPELRTKTELFFPLAGTLSLSINGTNEFPVYPEQYSLHAVSTDTVHVAKNSGNDSGINFLRIGFEAENMEQIRQQIDLNQINELIPVCRIADDILIHAGVFSGRSEFTINPQSEGNDLLFFVVNGAFDAGGRLLEYRDTLIIKQPKSVETEALSENAIILIAEQLSSKE